MKNKKLFAILKILISISILAILIYKIGIINIYDNIKTISNFAIILYLLTYIISWPLSSINLILILHPLNIKIKFKEILYIRVFSWCIGLISPGRIGEFSLVYLFKKKNIPTGIGSLVFILDTLITLIIMSLISIIGFFTFFPTNQTLKLIIIITIPAIILILTIFTEKGRKLLIKLFLKKYASLFAGFSTSLIKIIKEYKYLILNLILTTIKTISLSIIYYLLILEFGQSVSLYHVILIYSMTSLISLIPITLSGLGIRESASVYLYNLIGVNPTVIISIQIIYLTFNYTLATIAVLFYKN